MNHVLIFGGAGGIGLVTAQRLLKDGSQVTILDFVDEETGQSRIREHLSDPGSVNYIRVDIGDRETISSALETVDPFDAVVVTAAIVKEQPFLELEESSFKQHLDINIIGSFNVGQLAARDFVRRGIQGRIVLFSSWVQDYPWPDITAYSVSKAGVKMLVKQMARELAPHGIRVNSIAPGIVDSGMARNSIANDPKYAARVNGRIPLGELQKPEEIAAGISFLCSPDASAMTGTTLLVDGGLSLFKFDAPGAE